MSKQVSCLEIADKVVYWENLKPITIVLNSKNDIDKKEIDYNSIALITCNHSIYLFDMQSETILKTYNFDCTIYCDIIYSQYFYATREIVFITSNSQIVIVTIDADNTTNPRIISCHTQPKKIHYLDSIDVLLVYFDDSKSYACKYIHCQESMSLSFDKFPKENVFLDSTISANFIFSAILTDSNQILIQRLSLPSIQDSTRSSEKLIEVLPSLSQNTSIYFSKTAQLQLLSHKHCGAISFVYSLDDAEDKVDLKKRKQTEVSEICWTKLDHEGCVLIKKSYQGKALVSCASYDDVIWVLTTSGNIFSWDIKYGIKLMDILLDNINTSKYITFGFHALKTVGTLFIAKAISTKQFSIIDKYHIDNYVPSLSLLSAVGTLADISKSVEQSPDLNSTKKQLLMMLKKESEMTLQHFSIKSISLFLKYFESVNDLKAFQDADWEIMEFLLHERLVSVCYCNKTLIFQAFLSGKIDILLLIARFSTDINEVQLSDMLHLLGSVSSELLLNFKASNGILVRKNTTSTELRGKKRSSLHTDSLTILDLFQLFCNALLHRSHPVSYVVISNTFKRVSTKLAILFLRTCLIQLSNSLNCCSTETSTPFENKELAKLIEFIEALLDTHFAIIALELNINASLRLALHNILENINTMFEFREDIDFVAGVWNHLGRIGKIISVGQSTSRTHSIEKLLI